jgi:hypothetical protein
VIPGVGRVDPDQVAGQGGDLILRGGTCGWVLRHPDIVALQRLMHVSQVALLQRHRRNRLNLLS